MKVFKGNAARKKLTKFVDPDINDIYDIYSPI